MKTKSIKHLIKEYFFENPTEKLRVRQIERVLKVPLPSVIRYTKELEKEEILKINETAGVKFFTADRLSKKFLVEKTLFNIKSLSSSGLLSYLIENYSNPTIVVFGSYSKGEDIEKSDIDIYIETSSKKNISLEKFEKILHRRIQLFIHSDIKKISNPMLSNNIINGIILNGFLEVFK